MENIKAQINTMTSRSELEELIPLIYKRMESLVSKGLTIGCQVYVIQKPKKTLGVVKEIKQTRAIVDLPKGRCSVPLVMLEVA